LNPEVSLSFSSGKVKFHPLSLLDVIDIENYPKDFSNDPQLVRKFLTPTLTGSKILLRPITDGDFEDLYLAASDPELWRLHSEPDRYKREVFTKFFEIAVKPPTALVIVDKASGGVIGSTRFYDYRPHERQIVAGYTYLKREYWGGSTNRELKRLILTHAFKFVDKVLFHASEGNLRSRRALEKLGAIQRPGIFDIPGLGVRVEYAIEKSRWPEIKARIL
jgi:RimJ/RimL family protein N-acetyltransferase